METWKGVGCDLTILGMLAKEELIVRVRTLEFCSIWIIALVYRAVLVPRCDSFE